MVHDNLRGSSQALAKYQERGQLEGWLRRMAINRALDRLRTRKRHSEEFPLEQCVHCHKRVEIFS